METTDCIEVKKMNEQELQDEFTRRAEAAGLSIDCLGAGDIDSKIAIVVEAPGSTEKEMKMPLVGHSGKYLWSALETHAGIRRNKVYATNVCKKMHTLPSGLEGKSPIQRIELEHWTGLLHWELDQLPNLKYIIVLGNHALKAIVNEEKITSWRGSVVDIEVGRKKRRVSAVISFNPAMILRNNDMEPLFQMDMKKVEQVVNDRYKKHEIAEYINPSADDALEWINELQRSTTPIAFDIETMSYETACIGFANDSHIGYCINFRDNRTNRFTLAEECKIYTAIQELFLNPELKFVAQNGNFDSYWLGYKDRLHVPRIWFDTLLAHHTLYPHLPHNLGFLTSQYTTHPYYKDEGKSWKEGGNIDQFWRYNVKDCAITYAVHESMLTELQTQGMNGFFFDHVMALQPHLVRMTVNGIKADKALKDNIIIEMEDDIGSLRAQFDALVKKATGQRGLTINPSSPKQLAKLFFEELGLVGRGNSTDSVNRQRMKDHPRTPPKAIEMLTVLDKYKEEFKFLSTYAKMRIDDDQRIRCEWKQFGTQSAPGRLSSSSVMWGSGTNLQNQPARAYPMFIADKDYMFTYFDLSQAEARIVAYQWNVQGLIDTFEQASEDEEFDVHRGNAARIFKCDYSAIPKVDRDRNGKPTKRFLGKRCVHGLNYRMQAPKLAEVCNISLIQAHDAYVAYHQAFPEIQEAWKDIKKTIYRDRQLHTPLKRRMIYIGRIDEDKLDNIIAFVPQSTIGDKVSSVIYQCHNDPKWPESAHIVLNIHDALIAMHKEKDKKVVTKLMKDYAESPIIIRGHPVSIPTDFKHSVADEKGIHRWSTLT